MDNNLDELNAEQTAGASIEENIMPALPGDVPEYTVDDSEYIDLSMYFLKDDTGLIDLFEDEETLSEEVCEDEQAEEFLSVEEEVFADTVIPAVCEDLPGEGGTVIREETVPEEQDAVVLEDVPSAEEETIPQEDVLSAEAAASSPEEENGACAETEEISEEKLPEEADGEADGPDDRTAQDKKKKKKWPLIAGIILLAGLLAFAGFRLFTDREPKANVLIHEGEICNAGGIEITVDDVCVIGSLLTYPLDPDYTYVAVQYTFRNTGNLELSWESTPYMMLRPFIQSEEGYVPVEAGTPEAEKLLSVYSSVADTAAVSESAPQSGEEEDTLSCLYGTFDYSALQIYSLDFGIDYSTVKDPLKSGESRVSADVFKIRKELFDTGMYYICADNQHAVIFIDPEPVDVDVKDPEASSDTQTGNGENAD